MPNFIKTPADEARWSKAKAAASKSKNKGEQSFDDQDWALVNHIYHQMDKCDDLGKAIKDFLELSKSQGDESSIVELESFLEKARRRLSDEVEDPSEAEDQEYGEDQGFHEYDPSQEQDVS